VPELGPIKVNGIPLFEIKSKPFRAIPSSTSSLAMSLSYYFIVNKL